MLWMHKFSMLYKYVKLTFTTKGQRGLNNVPFVQVWHKFICCASAMFLDGRRRCVVLGFAVSECIWLNFEILINFGFKLGSFAQ